MGETLAQVECHIMTGSTLAATFGRGRHQGVGAVTADEFTFTDDDGSVVVKERLADISEVKFGKLKVLQIVGSKTYKMYIDPAREKDRPNSFTAQIGDLALGGGESLAEFERAGRGIQRLSAFYDVLHAAWKSSKG